MLTQGGAFTSFLWLRTCLPDRFGYSGWRLRRRTAKARRNGGRKSRMRGRSCTATIRAFIASTSHVILFTPSRVSASTNASAMPLTPLHRIPPSLFNVIGCVCMHQHLSHKIRLARPLPRAALLILSKDRPRAIRCESRSTLEGETHGYRRHESGMDRLQTGS